MKINDLILPTPKEFKDYGKKIFLGNMTDAHVKIKKYDGGEVYKSAVKHLKKSLLNKLISIKNDSEYEIIIKTDKNHPCFNDKTKNEAYYIKVSEEKTEIVGYDDAGSFYGAVTFGKILYNAGNEVYIPLCEITDEPYFEKRGHFLECRYGSDFMDYKDYKDAIDYFAETKINKITLGLYGCWDRQYDRKFAEFQYVPLKKYPELKTPRNIKYYSAKEGKYIYKKDVLPTMYEKDYLLKLIKYAKSKNIEIIPLFNSLGHNTLIPRAFPEISAKYENGSPKGVGFCTNNQKTYEIMFGIYDEIIDKYLNPCGIDSFELGLDEVWDVLGADKNDLQQTLSPVCKCEKCRNSELGELMLSYIIKIVKHMKSKGINNVYIYHDMLFKHGFLNDDTKKLLIKEGIYENIIIDYWSYSTEKSRLFGGKVNDLKPLFRSIGKPWTAYYHWVLPTQSLENCLAMKEVAMENNFEGLVAYGSFDYSFDLNYNMLAQCAWNPGKADKKELINKYAEINFRENPQKAIKSLNLMTDIMYGENNYCLTKFSYYWYTYLRKDTEYPQNYPSKVFVTMENDEKLYMDYLENTYKKAKDAEKFFKKNPSFIGEYWLLTSRMYMYISDVFKTVYMCNKDYSLERITEKTYIDELKRLLYRSNELIRLIEDTRIKANIYTLARNISVIRQFVCDLMNYMESEVKEGIKPEKDIVKTNKYLSRLSIFLR